MPNNVNYNKLLEGIKKIIKRGDYTELLKSVNKLKNDYSFRNTILVYCQNPNATIVKGFRDWNKLGRGVKKSPKTIYIYCPIKIKKQKRLDEQQDINGREFKERNEKVEEIEGISYRKIAVFDIGDTYILKGSRRIPIIDDKIDNNTTKELYDKLINISPVPVIQENLHSIKKGYYSPKEKKIAIEANLSQDDKTAVLLHELCHCLYDDFIYTKDRDKSEILVESVAFLVADYFNFDTSLCSFGYITTWIENDIQEFMNLSNKIKETAETFIKLISESGYKQEKIGA